MKRLLAVVGFLAVLLFASHVSYAGVNLDQGANPASYGTSIVITTFTQSGGIQTNLTLTQAPGTAGGQACRNCFTKFLVQESTNVVLNILDGATTDYVIMGIGLGASGVNTLQFTEDHAGPVCMGTGNTTTFNAVVTTPFLAGNPISVEAEGYTYCGQSRNANN